MARCPHYGVCGGCTAQDLGYAEQLAAKAAALETLFAPWWSAPIAVAPSPVLWHYRNKVDPAFARKRYDEKPPKDFVKETVIGFKRRGHWYWPLDIGECPIGPEGLDALLAAVRGWYRAAGHRAYDERSGDGVLRHLLVRDAKRTGQRMVMLIATPAPIDTAPFVEAVRGAFAPQSIYLGRSTASREVAIAEELELLDGAPAIDETLDIPDGAGGLRTLHFRISPFSFFQTNPRAAEGLYAAVRAWARRVRPAHLYDLYGGMGGIAFACADLAGQVRSVESVASASEDGRANAAHNGIGNVEFHTAPVEKYLAALPGGLEGDAAVVVDPARGGMHPKALARLIEMAPRDLCYVSCNPAQLARDLPALLERFRLESLEAFDLFPHTPHAEALAIFRRA